MINIKKMSREKLIKAGFKFIRLTGDPFRDGTPYKILLCDNADLLVWKTVDVCKTKKAQEMSAAEMIAKESCLCLE